MKMNEPKNYNNGKLFKWKEYLFCPRAFDKVRIENFLPSVKTLYISTTRDCFCDFLPILSSIQHDCTSKGFILKKQPTNVERRGCSLELIPNKRNQKMTIQISNLKKFSSFECDEEVLIERSSEEAKKMGFRPWNI